MQTMFNKSLKAIVVGAVMAHTLPLFAGNEVKPVVDAGKGAEAGQKTEALSEMKTTRQERMTKLLQDMKLTSAQQTLYDASVKAGQVVGQESRNLYNDVKSLASSAQHDEKKVRALIAVRQKKLADDLERAAQKMQDFFKSLTDEQKKQWSDFLQPKTAKMKKGEG